MKLFPGCTLASSARHYRHSLQWLLSRLGREVEDLPDWNCCGATSAHALCRPLALDLPARNLAIAQGLKTDLLAPCSACFSRLRLTQAAIGRDTKFRQRWERMMDIDFANPVKVRNILEYLGDEAIQARIARERSERLKGLKVVCYYGCLLTRLPRVSLADDVENPQSMERLVQATGAEPVDWPHKTACCGAAFSVIQEKVATDLSTRILEMAERCGADAVVTVCPFCQYNLDYAQYRLTQDDGLVPQIPVVFITQLLGMALGADDRALKLSANLHEPRALLARL